MMNGLYCRHYLPRALVLLPDLNFHQRKQKLTTNVYISPSLFILYSLCEQSTFFFCRAPLKSSDLHCSDLAAIYLYKSFVENCIFQKAQKKTVHSLNGPSRAM